MKRELKVGIFCPHAPAVIVEESFPMKRELKGANNGRQLFAERR